jgi:hypothetical protein
MTIPRSRPAGPEDKAFVEENRALVVAFYLHLDAVEAAKGEAVLADQAGCFGAVAVAPESALANADEQG